jgi:hypothetical protein
MYQVSLKSSEAFRRSWNDKEFFKENGRFRGCNSFKNI